MEVKRGIAICHYNRWRNLQDIVCAVYNTAPEGARIVVCDDGSMKFDPALTTIQGLRDRGIPLILGPNLGVAANKNRALFALQDCHFIAILEDDLLPQEPGWFELYEKAATLSGINHFCRVQDKLVTSLAEDFDAFMKKEGMSPIYGGAPRGDLTFITKKVIDQVGAFNPRFRGAGYAHLEWSERVVKAGLVGHPNQWVDIREARDKLVQHGDKEGGRLEDGGKIQKQIDDNLDLYLRLKSEPYIYHPLVLE